MLRIQHAIETAGLDIKLFSVSIDSKRDSVPVLKRYADKLAANPELWSFLTGDQAEIEKWGNLFQAAISQDRYAPGGFMHSGALSVVDQDGKILGVFDGTVDAEVDALIAKLPSF